MLEGVIQATNAKEPPLHSRSQDKKADMSAFFISWRPDGC